MKSLLQNVHRAAESRSSFNMYCLAFCQVIYYNKMMMMMMIFQVDQVDNNVKRKCLLRYFLFSSFYHIMMNKDVYKVFTTH